MRRTLPAVLTAVALSAVAGCVQFSSDVNIDAKGGGTATVSMSVASDVLAARTELDRIGGDAMGMALPVYADITRPYLEKRGAGHGVTVTSFAKSTATPVRWCRTPMATPASWRAMSALLDGVPDDVAPKLIARIIDRGTAYDDDAPAGTRALSTNTTWRQLYDLFEAAGNRDTADIMRTWVLPKTAAADVRDRKPARTAYLALNDSDGDWLPPLGVRSQMARWDFDDARKAMTAAQPLARAAAAAQEAAEATGLNLGATQRAYEMAGAAKDYPALTAQLAATVETVARYRATQALLAEPTGPVARLGARIAPDTTPLATAAAAIDAGDLAAADGFLQAIADEREQQTAYGWYAVSGTGALVALGAALLFWRNQRRRGTARA